MYYKIKFLLSLSVSNNAPYTNGLRDDHVLSYLPNNNLKSFNESLLAPSSWSPSSPSLKISFAIPFVQSMSTFRAFPKDYAMRRSRIIRAYLFLQLKTCNLFLDAIDHNKLIGIVILHE